MRGRGLAVAGVGVLVALTGLVACSGDEERPAAPIDASYALDGRLSCDSSVKEAPTLPLSDTPVAMVICAREGGGTVWTAPQDLLSGDLSEIVGVLADLEPTPEEPYECTLVGGPAFELQLELPGSRAVSVTGSTGGCGIVETGGRGWFGAPEVLHTVLDAVEEQRSRTEPSATIQSIDLDCNAGRETGLGAALSLTGEVADLTRLISCWQPNADETPPFPPGIEVTLPEIRALAADMAARAFDSTRAPALRCPGGLDRHYFQHLYGQTKWGDLVAVYGECRRFSFGQLDAQPRWWQPSPASQRILDGLRR